jgi:uncharacterized protein YndB with AHSA1/START domain
MPLKKDDSGRRWVEMEFLVPGTPEQVWQAIATGPGMSAWFTPTKVDEHVGGAIAFDFGDENCGEDTSSGKVTAWEPPARFAYEEYGWSGEAPSVATEVAVTSHSGDSCVVRMVPARSPASSSTAPKPPTSRPRNKRSGRRGCVPSSKANASALSMYGCDDC